MAEERDRHGISNNFNQDFPLSTYKIKLFTESKLVS